VLLFVVDVMCVVVLPSERFQRKEIPRPFYATERIGNFSHAIMHVHGNGTDGMYNYQVSFLHLSQMKNKNL